MSRSLAHLAPFTIPTGGILAILLGVAAVPLAAHAAPDFTATSYQYPAGHFPSQVAIADLNGDGKLDLVVANHGDTPAYGNTVSVLLGRGDGTYESRADYGTGVGPGSVAIADLNGDGKLDLMTGNIQSLTISVLPGAGDGTFGLPIDSPTAIAPGRLELGDMDGDGRLDLATSNSGSATVTTYHGNGDGTFGGALNYAVGSAPGPVKLRDLNQDGKLDLAVTNGGGLTRFLGNGNGTLGPGTFTATNVGASSVAVGDLNGDGHPDMVVTNYGPSGPGPFVPGHTISIFLGLGGGAFSKTGVDCDQFPSNAELADMNGDGRLDLLMASYGGVGTQLGNGLGGFAPATFATGSVGAPLAIADLDADGDLDIAGSDADAAGVLLGNGDGTYGSARSYNTGNLPTFVATGDVDGDGDADVVTANTFGNSVSVLLGMGDGTLGGRVDYPTGSESDGVAIGDFNGDSRPDLAVTNREGDNISVLLGTGGGSFGAATTYGTGDRATSIVATDLTNDGILDLAVANQYGYSISFLRGIGDGTFATPVNISVNFPKCVTAADLNGDGNMDLVHGTATGFGVLLGQGTGAFAPLSGGSLEQYSFPQSIATGDLDGDGLVDLVVVDQFYDKVWVYRGHGDGTFGVPTSIEPLSYPESASIADLNGDGKLDLAVGLSGSVAVFYGNGDGTFQARLGFGSKGNVYGLAIADFNGDGRIDMVTSGGGVGSAVTVLLRTTPGLPPTVIPVGLDIEPNAINLRALGNWATAAVTPPPPLTAADIDVGSLRLNGSVAVDPTAPVHVSPDGSTLTVRFRRAELALTLPPGAAVTVTLTGSITGGVLEGSDVVRVNTTTIHHPHAGDELAPGTTLTVDWDKSVAAAPTVAILASKDDGETWELIANELENTGSFAWTVPNWSTTTARLAVVQIESTDPGDPTGFTVIGALGITEAFAIQGTLSVPGAVAAFALRPLGNPVTGPLRVACSLPSAEPAMLQLFDVTGRLCAARRLDGVGSRNITLAEHVAPGLYIVQLAQRGRSLSSRVAVVR
jgi:hypothetical protein